MKKPDRFRCINCNHELLYNDEVTEMLANIKMINQDRGVPLVCCNCAYMFCYDEHGFREPTHVEFQKLVTMPSVLGLRHEIITSVCQKENLFR